MKFAMFAALTASLMACGPSPADSEATTRISASSQGHHAREVMVDCEDAVWTVHVRTSADVRAVEVLTPDAVSYATLDYPIRDGEGEVVGYGFLAYLPGVERVAAHTVRFRSEDVLALNAMLYFITAYDPKGALF